MSQTGPLSHSGMSSGLQAPHWSDLAPYGTSQNHISSSEYPLSFSSPSQDNPIDSSTGSSALPPLYTISQRALNPPWSGSPSIRGASSFSSATVLPKIGRSKNSRIGNHYHPSRRTLSDNDRKRMCQYHEANPAVKQTDIGNLFGVERSTVSKVLRQKDKFLRPDDGTHSPFRKSKSKSKHPDVETTLDNWAKNLYQNGKPPSDDLIRQQAKAFAATVSGDSTPLKINDAWLEKFKQKNSLASTKGRRLRNKSRQKGSTRKLAEMIPMSQTPSTMSDQSPSLRSGSLQASRTPPAESFLSYVEEPYQLPASSSGYHDIASGYTSGPLSPGSPYFSSNHPANQDSLFFGQSGRLPPPMNSRPCSHTVPDLGIEGFTSTHSSSESLSPLKYLTQSITPDTLNPSDELRDSDILNSLPRLAPAPSSPHIPPTQPPSFLQNSRHLDNPNHICSVHDSQLGAPRSPSREDLRSTLEWVMQRIQQEPRLGQECLVLSKLMERLGLRPPQQGGLTGFTCGLADGGGGGGPVC
ncbi:MAG: hypothetical protein M1814_006234 [Vezdaea aestivalis]|nr:MAG: hypothetical protein M1814_006234 [Vezdaea aestivalis]